MVTEGLFFDPFLSPIESINQHYLAKKLLCLELKTGIDLSSFSASPFLKSLTLEPGVNIFTITVSDLDFFW